MGAIRLQQTQSRRNGAATYLWKGEVGPQQALGVPYDGACKNQRVFAQVYTRLIDLTGGALKDLGANPVGPSKRSKLHSGEPKAGGEAFPD